jgi:Uma2 family endonuclease
MFKYAEKYITEDEYLEGEKDGQIRYELINGDVYAMTGASDKHNKISINMAHELLTKLKAKESSCFPYSADMKVKANNDFFYPDVMVVCDQQENDNAYYKTNPVVIVEVLSPSTRRTDKTLKRQAYQTLESLQEYVLIEQDKAEIEVFTRASGWQANYYYLGDEISLESIQVTLPVIDIYYQIDNEDIQLYLAEMDEAIKVKEN